jgi:DNA polymerase elongation subunit (family B)
MKRYDLVENYLQLFNTYPMINTPGWFKPFTPNYTEFELKIDNKQYYNNRTVRSPFVLNLDTFKIFLKVDPKRFTQYGRGNLDTMLKAYSIKNPYSGKELQKTGLSITEMFNLWDHSREIYKIALYCRQDAWICGTLLNSKFKLIDYIESALISNILVSDAIYKADGFKVSMSILAYAYKSKYALMDMPGPFRKDNVDKKLGGKVFDKRQIIGGAVENIVAGRLPYVVALDFAGQYPSQKESSNIDSSSYIDRDVLVNPDRYGLEIVDQRTVYDCYGRHRIIAWQKKDPSE